MYSDDVTLPAPKSTDLEHSINRVSNILVDLNKRIIVLPDGEVNVAPQLQLLANVAVDAHQSEQYLGLVEKIDEGKSGKESSNRTEFCKIP
jgi:phosphotransacetylase